MQSFSGAVKHFIGVEVGFQICLREFHARNVGHPRKSKEDSSLVAKDKDFDCYIEEHRQEETQKPNLSRKLRVIKESCDCQREYYHRHSKQEISQKE